MRNPETTNRFQWLVKRADSLADELQGNGCIELGNEARDRIYSVLEEAFEKGQEFANDTR